MKRILWLSLMPLTAFWLFAVNIYTQSSNTALALISILLGIIISIIGFWGSDAILDRRFLVLLVPLAVSCSVMPYPYNAGMIICILALLLSLMMPNLKPLWLGMLFAGIILSMNAMALSIYYLLAPNYHQAGWLSSILAFLSGLTGIFAASNEGNLIISALGYVFPFTVTLEKLGFYPWILIFSDSIILLTFHSAQTMLKRFLGVISVSFVYLLLRYIVLVNIFISSDFPEYARDRLDIFIDPWWIAFSFAPLILLLLWLYPLNDSRFEFRLDIDRRLAIGYVAVFISVFCLAGAAIYQDPGVMKNGRVLVDEIHSLWESSALKLDENWYGENSTYNAYSMIEWLNDTYRVHRITSPQFKDLNVPGATKIKPNVVSQNLTYDILKNYDILIIKTPSRYGSEEINAIESFVENGGGLFLIGDHTNFAGTGTNLNQISKRFGIVFGFDMVNNITGELFRYERGVLAHPIAKYMPSLDFMTGCSLIAPLGGESAILGFGMGADPGEYASVGFFRETRANDPTQVTDTVWGLINQAVAVKYGMGRVVAFPDSTVLSNFRIFFGGSPNLIIGSMEYLNRRNSSENANQIFFLVGLLAACLAAYLLSMAAWKDRKMAALIIILALASLSASGAMLAFSIKTESSIPSQFYIKNHTICFDAEHSDAIVTQGELIGQYETFFIWTQRANLTPSIETSLKEAMEKGKVVVIVDPVKPLSKEEVLLFRSYVKDGNNVLLMINSEGPWSLLAKNFGLETYQTAAIEPQKMIEYSELPIKPEGLAIRGGKTLLNISGRSVLAEANYGKGKFILFTDSSIFKDGFYGNPGYMGYAQSTPAMVDKKDYDLRALYNLEYSILWTCSHHLQE
jgi:hypothetical protein